MEHNRMPLMRYFIFVGGALLALLFVANACLPALPVAEASYSAPDLSVIRIHSDRKWPERVVFDTALPPIASAPVSVMAEAAAPQEKVAAAPSKSEVREAFAQLPTNPGHIEPKRKRKSATHAGPPRILVAQQRPVAFFGNNIW
jgi:hypothetical protein